MRDPACPADGHLLLSDAVSVTLPLILQSMLSLWGQAPGLKGHGFWKPCSANGSQVCPHSSGRMPPRHVIGPPGARCHDGHMLGGAPWVGCQPFINCMSSHPASENPSPDTFSNFQPSFRHEDNLHQLFLTHSNVAKQSMDVLAHHCGS